MVPSTPPRPPDRTGRPRRPPRLHRALAWLVVGLRVASRWLVARGAAAQARSLGPAHPTTVATAARPVARALDAAGG